MHRKLLYTLGAAGAAVALAVSLTGPSQGQNGEGQANNPNPKAEAPLPIKQVVLFNSGVGYFQREGEVAGNARIDLTFPASDINDLLKSLVLQDLGGGAISSVNYDSHDPIEKTLRSFALDLNNNPTFSQILNQARGEKIEITLKGDKGSTKVQGNIVGMEMQQKPVGKDVVTTVPMEVLNLSTANGLSAFPLDHVLSVRFLNPTLEREFQRALQVLASSHDSQKKLVSLGFNGQGKRAVRVGYVVERPIWKTTYRLRMEPNGKVFMQGWALVENTSDDDWNDVRMVLVSGKPISFQMNLYEPLYIPRPMVEPDLFASLRPPVYSGSLDPGANQPIAKGAPQLPMNVGGIGGGLGGMVGQGGYGNFAQNQQNFNNDQQRFQKEQLSQQQLANNRLTYEELQDRRQKDLAKRDEAKKSGAAIAGLNFKEGIASVASSEEVGDYYRYIIDQRVSLQRQRSSMLPILDQTIEGHKVSIFNHEVHARFPLLGLKLKNTSGQPLTQGPITVYEDGAYAGDTRILDLQPNEERYLSYALDQATEVKCDHKTSPSPNMNFKIGEAQLTANFKLRQTKTFTIKNRSNNDRTVILEHPITPTWALVDPATPTEKTRSHYRFTVLVQSGKTVKYDVVEEQARVDSFSLATGGRPPHYPIGMGVDVKQITAAAPEKLTGLKIAKGLVFPAVKQRESRTYFVQNLSEENRDFTVDHIVRPEWTRMGDAGENQKGPEVFRFVLKVDKGKTGQKEVVEERIFNEKPRAIKDLGELKIKEYLANNAPSADVKAALSKALTLAQNAAATKVLLDEQKTQLDIISTDQERLRKNLQIIPQSAEPYKKFLDKFVAQETEIEAEQRQIRQLTTRYTAEVRDYELFLANLNVD